ncbi:MAG TPA: ParA family protein [Ornithinimicrobium sp.]|nr:ParA family protein [Ornithinimicrobium sp.]
MTSTHREALGWPRRPDHDSWGDPRWAGVFGDGDHLGWPQAGSASWAPPGEEGRTLSADVSRETRTAGFDPVAGTPVNGHVSRETTTTAGRVATPIADPDATAAAPTEATTGTSTEAPTAGSARTTRSWTAGVPASANGTAPPGRAHAWTGTRVMTVANQKGGVGKTTTAVNIAAAMAGAGLRVLVIDMDPQGNASTALSIPHASGTMGVYDVLIDSVPLADVVVGSPHVPGLFGVPATIDLAGAEIELVPLVARENRLRRALSTFLESRSPEETFDLVLIDCPPSLGLLTVNSFVAADEVLIPIQCEYYALEGLSQLVKNVELIKQHLNAGLTISTILLTMFDARTRLSAEVADQVREYFGARVLRAAIPRSVRISEAPSHGETVITYDPASTGALSYVEAAAQMRQQEVSA